MARKIFYYQIDEDNTMTIYNEQGMSVADISDCDENTDIKSVVGSTLYWYDLIGEKEPIILEKYAV